MPPGYMNSVDERCQLSLQGADAVSEGAPGTPQSGTSVTAGGSRRAAAGRRSGAPRAQRAGRQGAKAGNADSGVKDRSSQYRGVTKHRRSGR